MLGLMPHPEHAVDPLTGSTDGLRLFEARRRGAERRRDRRAVGQAPRARPDRLRVRAASSSSSAASPNDVELAMFSLLWSEHCAYKHSRKLLRRLPTEGERVVMGPGENAGAVDVGNGYAVAFKVESHNHPSAVEPFQGAATGVGGILRDVFAIGARPIAILDSPALRRARLRALALPARRRGARDRPLRQLDRGADGRRRDLLRGALRAQLPGQRDVRRHRPARRRWSAPPPPGSATRSC